ncbi:arsenate reductase [alpha proteobacterium U9-1i]|nr:arsenate reductase [alpha proteobacterium U9-1i]
MPKRFPVVIFHNPKCTTSSNVLDLIARAGHKPVVIEYLKTGWTEAQLHTLFAAANLTPREALRAKAKEADELGLLGPKVTDAKVFAAMLKHPVLVERPFVVTPKGVRLCRPSESVRELL